MEEWKKIRLGDIVEVASGFSYKGEYIGSGRSILLGMGCVSFKEKFLMSGARPYSGESPDRFHAQPGDIVLDGFCGTGMTGVAANLCGSPTEVSSLHEKNVKVGARHAICSDLSPIATLISAQYNLKFNPNSFRKKANSVLDKVEEELGWLFRVN